jgi:uncharacterized protein DUF1616
MRRDTLVTAAVTVVTALLTGFPGARIPAGLLLVLLLPGYALSALVLPGRPPSIGPLLWRAMWVAGLSLAVTVLAGLLLNLLPGGLTRTSWTISLTAVTLLACAWPSPQDQNEPLVMPVMRIAAGYAVAALAIAGTATGLAVASAGWQHSPGFAQLWLVPAGNGQASLGVRSGYARAEVFRLVLRRGQEAPLSWDFTLRAGQTWRQTVSAQAGQHLAAQLTVTGQQTAGLNVDITGEAA